MTRAHHLDESLSSLRAEIRALDIGDEEARQRLDNLVADIAASVDGPEPGAADEKLTGRLEASMLGFEASHPRLARLMNDVLEKLSAMGI